MKTLLCLILFGFLSFSSRAQTQLEFRIYHKLGSDPYAWNSPVMSGSGEMFKVTRLQYYISRFTVIHDGGQETAISDDTIALIKATSGHTAIQLGSHSVTSIEGVKFHIGVFAPVNNEDPAQYPPEHPLAPQVPAMHWGWASGYRFLAFEGQAGNNFTQTFELHTLGNPNYHEQTISLSGQDVNGKMVIAVDADYIEGLRNISVSNGVIAHGDDLEDKTTIENFRDYVFSARTDALNLNVDELESNQISLYPNPASAFSHIFVQSNSSEIVDIEIFDYQGRRQEYKPTLDGTIEAKQFNPGTYLVRIRTNAGEVCKRLTVL